MPSSPRPNPASPVDGGIPVQSNSGRSCPAATDPHCSAAFTFMKTKNTLGILAAFTFLVGCTPPHRGPAYGHEQEFRRQLADSVPVKDWGFKIQDIRFSEDYYKALILFAVPGKTNMQETVLEDDGFRRYKGLTYDYDKMTAFKTNKLADMASALQAASCAITVTIPSK